MRWRRLLPNIRYGTGRYPEKVARRLTATNIAAWLAALVVGGFALQRLLNPGPWYWGIDTALVAVAMASVPLLHRFGPVTAPLALIAIVYGHIFNVVTDLAVDRACCEIQSGRGHRPDRACRPEFHVRARWNRITPQAVRQSMAKRGLA